MLTAFITALRGIVGRKAADHPMTHTLLIAEAGGSEGQCRAAEARLIAKVRGAERERREAAEAIVSLIPKDIEKARVAYERSPCRRDDLERAVYARLPELIDHVIDTWVQEVLNPLVDPFNFGGATDGDWSGLMMGAVLPGLGVHFGDDIRFEETERVWNHPCYVSFLVAYRRLVLATFEAGWKADRLPEAAEDIDRTLAALATEQARTITLPAFMRLYWDEVVVQHRDENLEVPYANDEMIGDGMDWPLRDFMQDQAIAFGLLDTNHNGDRIALTLDGYRYLFERVFGLPSVNLPEPLPEQERTDWRTPREMDRPGLLPFDDPRSLAVVQWDSATGQVQCRPLTEAFRFRDPKDAEWFAETVGE